MGALLSSGSGGLPKQALLAIVAVGAAVYQMNKMTASITAAQGGNLSGPAVALSPAWLQLQDVLLAELQGHEHVLELFSGSKVTAGSRGGFFTGKRPAAARKTHPLQQQRGGRPAAGVLEEQRQRLAESVDKESFSLQLVSKAGVRLELGEEQAFGVVSAAPSFHSQPQQLLLEIDDGSSMGHLARRGASSDLHGRAGRAAFLAGGSERRQHSAGHPLHPPPASPPAKDGVITSSSYSRATAAAVDAAAEGWAMDLCPTLLQKQEQLLLEEEVQELQQQEQTGAAGMPLQQRSMGSLTKAAGNRRPGMHAAQRQQGMLSRTQQVGQTRRQQRRLPHLSARKTGAVGEAKESEWLAGNSAGSAGKWHNRHAADAAAKAALSPVRPPVLGRLYCTSWELQLDDGGEKIGGVEAGNNQGQHQQGQAQKEKGQEDMSALLIADIQEEVALPESKPGSSTRSSQSFRQLAQQLPACNSTAAGSKALQLASHLVQQRLLVAVVPIEQALLHCAAASQQIQAIMQGRRERKVEAAAAVLDASSSSSSEAGAAEAEAAAEGEQQQLLHEDAQPAELESVLHDDDVGDATEGPGGDPSTETSREEREEEMEEQQEETGEEGKALKEEL